MARRKHHRRRHFRGLADLVSIPSLGRMDVKALNPLKSSVNSNDVFLGAAIGVAGGVLFRRYVVDKFMAKMHLPAFVVNNIQAFSGLGAGLAAYLLLKKKSPGRAKGVWVGSVLAAVGPSIWEMTKAKIPQLNDLVSVNLNGYGRYGMLIDDASDGLHGYGGMLIDDRSDARALAAYSMEMDSDEDALL